MGIRGLMTFLKQNKFELFQPKDFQGSFVFDGSNFFHIFVRNSSSDNFAFGGDYDAIAEDVDRLLQTFQDWNVKPIFYFGGAQSLVGPGTEDTRWKIRCERAAKRVSNAANECFSVKEKVVTENGRVTVFPAFFYKTVMEKLEERGIEFAVCRFEIDLVAINKAEELKCPIVTSDSDFFLTNLTSGVILADDVLEAYEKANGSKRPPKVSLYKYDYLLRKYKISSDNQSIPKLLAAFLPNDFFEHEILQNFQKRPRPGDLLQMVSKAGCLDDAITMMLRKVRAPGQRHEELRKVIKRRIKDYDISCAAGHTPDLPAQEPEIFWRTFQQQFISDYLASGILHKRIIIQTQFEDIEKCCSWECSVEIRRVCYGILNESTSNLHELTEYRRRGLSLDKFVIQPLEIIGSAPCPTLEEIQNWSDSERQEFLLMSMEAKEVNMDVILQSTCIPAAVMKRLTPVAVFWCKHSHLKHQKEHLLSLLLYTIKMISGKKSQELQEIKNESRDTDFDVLHAFAQLQAVLRNALDLMALLSLPFSIPIYKVFSGKFLHNLTIRLIELEQQPAIAYCQELLGVGSDEGQLIEDWFNSIDAACRVD